MPTLRLNLLGQPQVLLDGAPVTAFDTAKSQALLFYLALTGRAHGREVLAALLWGDMPEAGARRNLTKALSTVRRAVAPFVVVERQSISLDPDLPVEVDALLFRQAVEAALEAGPHHADAAHLRAALDLYRGDLFEGFSVRDSLEFEEWASAQRESLRELRLQALDSLVAQHLHRGEYAAGIEAANRLLALDPWRESAHRQLMQLLARSGQRSAALAQYEASKRRLAEELGVEPMPETTALYERLKSAGTPPPHNLPPPSPTFVGREAELTQLAAYLDDPQYCLVTVVGPGGIGKTRLALRAARRYVQPEMLAGVGGFPDGVFLISLAHVTGSEAGPEPVAEAEVPALLAGAIAAELDLSLRGPGEAFSQVARALRGKTMLLVLDNFEHLVLGAGCLTDLLRQAPGLRLLVTSRERLNLQDEWVFSLGGLEYPAPSEWEALLAAGDEHAPGGVERALRYGAVALFAQRAQQVRASLQWTGDDLAAVLRICELVQGSPLALELAAAWLRALPPAEVAAQLERSPDFLATTRRDVPERHRSLRAVFEYSWKMLSRAEQEAFQRLAVFHGSFGCEAAEAVTGAPLPVLASLVDKSLLWLTGNGQYRMHELLRQYAAEKLWEAGGDLAESVWERYSAYYLSMAGAHEAALCGGTPAQATSALRGELDNLRRAWAWAINELRLDQLSASLDALGRFFDVMGLFQEGEAAFQNASETVLAALGTFVRQGRGAEARAVASRLLTRHARLLHRRGLGDQAAASAARAVELALNDSDTALEAAARHAWGEALVQQGDYGAAVTQLELALALARQAGLPRVAAEAERDLGIAAHLQSDYAAAERRYEAALAGFRALDDRRNEGIVGMNLGSLAYNQGLYAAARYRFEQALQDFRDIGDRWGELMVTSNLGYLAAEDGRYEEGLALCNQALTMCRKAGDLSTEANVLHTLGNLLRSLGQYAGARAYYDQALRGFRRTAQRHGEGQTLADRALLLHLQDDHAAAALEARQALRLARALPAPALEAQALTCLGHALLAQGQTAEAEGAYRRALEVTGSVGEPAGTRDAAAGLARAALARGRAAEALDHLGTVLPALPGGQLPGTLEPARVHLTAYRVLRATDDPRAGQYLAGARAWLLAQAESISDEALRRSFLEQVAAHRELLQEKAMAKEEKL